MSLSNQVVNFLAVWQLLPSEAKLVIRHAAQVLVPLISADLEHADHVLSLVELMLHLFRLEILAL